MSGALDKPVRRDEELSLTIDEMGQNGDGIGRVGLYIVFVPGALPGELVLVRITSAGRKFGRGVLLEVLEPAENRVDARCRHFGDCGGCSLQHLVYAEQLRHKTAYVRTTLAHALGGEPDHIPVRDMVGPDDPWGHRNKIALQIGGHRTGLRAGLFGSRSVRIVDTSECPVSDREGFRLAMDAVAVAAREGLTAWDSKTDSGILRAIVVRSFGRGQRLLTFVCRKDPGMRARRAFAKAPAQGVFLNFNDSDIARLLGKETEKLKGEDWLEVDISGIRYRVGPTSFFQTSIWGAERLVDATLRLLELDKESRVLDLFCGSGLLSLAVAPHVGRVLGVEENRRAVQNADACAKKHGFDNARFEHARVEHVLGGLLANAKKPDAVIVDPPRGGLHHRVAKTICYDLQPAQLLYVSGDVESLGEDLKELRRGGYEASTIEPLDLFPHSAHTECVVLLERRMRGQTGKRRASMSLARRALRRSK